MYKYHVTKQGSNWCMVNKNSHKTFFFIINYHILQEELYLEFKQSPALGQGSYFKKIIKYSSSKQFHYTMCDVNDLNAS